MNSVNIELLAEDLIRRVKSYLINTIGRTADEANSDEFYRALSYAIREETMINWLATARTVAKNNVRMIYYLSMEYLPGRLFMNNITNLCSKDVVRIVMQKMNRNFRDIIQREDDPGLGNGGLGRLASCLLDSLATHHYPAQAYGLRYQYGIFEQQIWDGMQVEAPDCWLINENPWEFRRDNRRVHVKFCGTPQTSYNIHGDEIMDLKDAEEVGALPYDIPIVGYSKNADFSVVSLRLWSTKDSPRNFLLQRYNAGRLDQAAENTTLTDVLYPSDNTEIGKRVRLKQEFLLVSASLQDIVRHYLVQYNNFRLFSEKVRIQINDTHPSLVIAELMRILTKEHDLPWKTAFEITQTCTGYTNHTILSEALEQWDRTLMYYLLPRQYRIIERINQDFCTSIRARYPQDEERVRRMSIIENNKVRMANLAIVGSHRVNGVAKLHTEILKNVVFKDFYELFPDKFVNVTNGVTQRRWLLECNSDLAKFITKRIGDEWITNFLKVRELARFAADPDSQDEFLAIKRKNKLRCIEFLNRDNKLRDQTGTIVAPPPLIEIDSMFDVQVKRIHEYKRQLMNALHLIMLYQEIAQNPNHDRIKRTAIIGGKAAAGYETAKDIIRLICCIARKVNRDVSVGNQLKIVYLENYNVTKAEIVIPATDLSEQISTAGTEASGTGNMKMAINGALTIGTKDGANIEMEEEITPQWWPFSFGCTAEQIAQMKAANAYSSRDVYESNPKIKQAVDTLRDRTFAQTEEEHQVFSDLYHKLIEMHYGEAPDRYFTLKDLQSYYDTQLKAEALYKTPRRWAEYAIHNIAGMGKFSTDFSIHKYAELIWGIQPCPLDQELLDRVRYDYAAHNRCS
ncbi:glycogen/starch/alpha-glucan phosphorylase [Candidatus Protochlamydia phocaeensis]|uniref:glycogen/starch/alpha-glucan phosphorylase n=1 Tax=Candidatus Protochlamydia phocaeensis TaxID=1414722 RepID=UPI000838F93E|nr:glycogen/starch/alpha-glucan phosphorylase [Candidatus Protochlamydia phocaeensis]